MNEHSRVLFQLGTSVPNSTYSTNIRMKDYKHRLNYVITYDDNYYIKNMNLNFSSKMEHLVGKQISDKELDSMPAKIVKYFDKIIRGVKGKYYIVNNNILFSDISFITSNEMLVLRFNRVLISNYYLIKNKYNTKDINTYFGISLGDNIVERVNLDKESSGQTEYPEDKDDKMNDEKDDHHKDTAENIILKLPDNHDNVPQKNRFKQRGDDKNGNIEKIKTQDRIKPTINKIDPNLQTKSNDLKYFKNDVKYKLIYNTKYYTQYRTIHFSIIYNPKYSKFLQYTLNFVKIDQKEDEFESKPVSLNFAFDNDNIIHSINSPYSKLIQPLAMNKNVIGEIDYKISNCYSKYYKPLTYANYQPSSITVQCLVMEYFNTYEMIVDSKIVEPRKRLSNVLVKLRHTFLNYKSAMMLLEDTNTEDYLKRIAFALGYDFYDVYFNWNKCIKEVFNKIKNSGIWHPKQIDLDFYSSRDLFFFGRVLRRFHQSDCSDFFYALVNLDGGYLKDSAIQSIKSEVIAIKLDKIFQDAIHAYTDDINYKYEPNQMMIRYINELIVNFELATGNSRWPPVKIENKQFTTDDLSKIYKTKSKYKTEGYNQLTMYGTYLDISDPNVIFNILLNQNPDIDDAKNPQLAQKIVIYFSSIYICGIKVEFNDDSFSKRIGEISAIVQLIEIPFKAQISYLDVEYDESGIVGLGFHTYKKVGVDPYIKEFRQVKSTEAPKKPENMKNISLKVNEGIIGLKVAFKDKILKQIGFVFKQVISLLIEVESVTQLNEKEQLIIDPTNYSFNPNNIIMNNANVAQLEKYKKDKYYTIMINSDKNFNQNITLSLDYNYKKDSSIPLSIKISSDDILLNWMRWSESRVYNSEAYEATGYAYDVKYKIKSLFCSDADYGAMDNYFDNRELYKLYSMCIVYNYYYGSFEYSDNFQKFDKNYFGVQLKTLYSSIDEFINNKFLQNYNIQVLTIEQEEFNQYFNTTLQTISDEYLKVDYKYSRDKLKQCLYTTVDVLFRKKQKFVKEMSEHYYNEFKKHLNKQGLHDQIDLINKMDSKPSVDTERMAKDFIDAEITKHLELKDRISLGWWGSNFMYVYGRIMQDSLKSTCEPFFFAFTQLEEELYGYPKYRGSKPHVKRINMSLDLDHLLNWAAKQLEEDYAAGPGAAFKEDDIDEIDLMNRLATSVKMYETPDEPDIKTQAEIDEDKDDYQPAK